MKKRSKGRSRASERERSRKRCQQTAQRRAELIKRLAPPDSDGRCACDECGALWVPDMLEVDHVDGITWDDRAVNSGQRVDRFWDEFNTGVRLRALCKSCNSRDGAKRAWRNGVYA